MQFKSKEPDYIYELWNPEKLPKTDKERRGKVKGTKRRSEN
jgi:hypothetical protein